MAWISKQSMVANHSESERTCIPTIVQVVYSGLGFGFPFEASVDVANKMVSHVVADMELKQVAKLGQFTGIDE